MKRKSVKKAGEVNELAWRPDFRNRDSLPDIKTVRTSFFLSALALTLATMSLMHVGFYEFTIYSFSKKIEKGKTEVSAQQGLHAKAIGMNNRFIESERRIDEINTFIEGQMIGSDLLLDVGGNLMPGMSLSGVEFKEDRTVLHGYVEASEQTDSLLREYMERLREVDSIKGRYSEITQVSVERQEGSDQMKFHLEAINPEEDAGPKKKS